MAQEWTRHLLHGCTAVSSVQAWSWPASPRSLDRQNANHFDENKAPQTDPGGSRYVHVRKSSHHFSQAVFTFMLLIFIKVLLLLMTIIIFFYTYYGTPLYYSYTLGDRT